MRTDNKAYRLGKSLIQFSDIERVFDASTIRELAHTAKLSPDADLDRFAQSVRTDVRLFVEEKNRLNLADLSAQIKRLYQLTTRAERGNDKAAHNLARALDSMSNDVSTWLKRCTPRAVNIPTTAEIISAGTRRHALRRMIGILSYGGTVVKARKRPNGRRSLSYEPLLRAPAQIKRGAPRQKAEREFVRWLALTYATTTGKSPPPTANYNQEIRGPFSRFVHRCFELVGARTGGVTELINEHGNIRLGKRPRQRNPRRQVKPT